jgi:UDP-N-acetylglucosamine 2-epimerase (non-hydrolysing)
MKVLTVFGTRPEAIKMAPVIHALSKRETCAESLVCVTGQHREMLDEVLRIFSINPQYDLDIMRKSFSLTDIACGVQEGLGKIIKDTRPDIILVHGDTTTSAAASLAAFYNRIPIGHVEAGLRTGNIYSPWPEEANRRIISVVAAHHFAPTSAALNNLLTEGVDEKNILVTGNTVIDSLHYASQKLESDENLRSNIGKQFTFIRDESKIVLVTAHRRENHGDRLASICNALINLASCNRDVQIIFPVHPNPAVRSIVESKLLATDRIYLIEPLDYISFIYLLKKSTLVLTDSGGLQEEGPALRKPVLVLRDTTERPEAVHAGGVKLIGTDSQSIVNEATLLLSNPKEYDLMAESSSPFGDGHASSRIVDYLQALYQ